jgi:hypothetical protein
VHICVRDWGGERERNRERERGSNRLVVECSLPDIPSCCAHFRNVELVPVAVQSSRCRVFSVRHSLMLCSFSKCWIGRSCKWRKNSNPHYLFFRALLTKKLVESSFWTLLPST